MKTKTETKGIAEFAGVDGRTVGAALEASVRARGHEAVRNLYDLAAWANARWYGGKLGRAAILVTPPSSPRAHGDYIAAEVHGMESRIRIAPKTAAKGFRFAAATLLHDLAHAATWELEHDGEDGYEGHGPRFAARCNVMGGELGLSPCAAKGRGAKGGELMQKAARWPLWSEDSDAVFAAGLAKLLRESSAGDDAARGGVSPVVLVAMADALELERSAALEALDKARAEAAAEAAAAVARGEAEAAEAAEAEAAEAEGETVESLRAALAEAREELAATREELEAEKSRAAELEAEAERAAALSDAISSSASETLVEERDTREALDRFRAVMVERLEAARVAVATLRSQKIGGGRAQQARATLAALQGVWAASFGDGETGAEAEAGE